MWSILKYLQTKKQKSITGFNVKSLSIGLCTLCICVFISGCVVPVTQVGIVDLSARPGEKALLSGIRSYDDGQYAQSEVLLSESLKAGFTVTKDAALAHKFLAFIYCTSNRIKECEQAFISAKAVDPSFTLNKNEIGHPLWGPIYKKIFNE
jgi:hypothetical protein